MSDLSFEKIEQSIRDRKELYEALINNTKTYKSLAELEPAVFADGALKTKTKELMAVAVSITTQCEPCMEWHVCQALKAGATDEEVYETIDVAIAMGGGRAGAYARFALKAMAYFKASDRER